jgi:putative restriction endonuclease
VGDETWAERFSGIRQWQRGSERAPHKPLLLLYALGRLQRTGSSVMPFVDAEEDLARLLAEFGPPRSSSPAYPFHHLQTDGFWTVTTDDGSDPGSAISKLRSTNATGQLASELELEATKRPAMIPTLAHALLGANWPPSLHADIASAVGLDVDVVAPARVTATRRRTRDPKFRDLVLVAYEYRCAFCGYDGRIGSDTVALEAAHVQWHANEGPDTVENGLCLCSLHHKLLDLGAMGITPEHGVAVSGRFAGQGETAERMVLDLVDRPIRLPQPGQPQVAAVHIDWHRAEVFRDPQRQAT